MNVFRPLLPLLVSTALFAQTPAPLLDAKLLDLLHESLSGELAKEYVIGISRHHRIQGSRGYRDAANYVLGELKKAGFSEKDAAIESFKSDGKIVYQTWQSPSGWDISSAELRMVEPYDERIVGYPEIAMSLITYSNPGDATAELVWVGPGTSDADYEGKDVKGKFVLATGYGGEVHRLAVLKYGAKAVVCYLADERAANFPDMLQYTGMWPKTDELDRTTFGFNLTNRQGEKLKELLASGRKVVMRGWVKGTGLEPYAMDVVVAHIRGSERPEEELVFSAHLDHPKESANDNASGSAAILDIARSLNELIGSGKLPRPKRSFRFVWVPEWNGTMAYVDAHPELTGPELGGKFLANINMDMVGENPEILHSKMYITRTPLSIPSCLNDVAENMAEAVDRLDVRTPRGSLSEFNYRVVPYSGGSDHMMFIDRKVPGVMFGHSDYTHHTSEDTPDKVDPVELERCEIISAGTMWYLANLDEAQAADLARLSYANGLRRFGLELRRAAAIEAPSPSAAVDIGAAQNLIDYGYRDARQTVGSVLGFNAAAGTKALVEDLQARLEGAFRSSSVATSELYPRQGEERIERPGDVKGVDRVPSRLTRGPLDFALPASALSAEDAAWYATPAFTLDGDQRFELVNFIDGRRSVREIRNAVSACGRPVDAAVVYRYLDDLVKAKALRWNE
jgi:aminopeptidase YwaD